MQAMTLPAGTRLGPYEILGPLGAGGMGEVYRARDPRLGRDVAVKVLPAEVTRTEEAQDRFEREARAVAALSHPNILSIHDVGNQDGRTYAVMELLEGETLRARLERGPLPWRKAVDVAVAIAEGLAAAHAKGIVHRDVKPANLFLTFDGRVKLLDFGLAKLWERFDTEGSNSSAATVSQTEAGRMVGTAGYMSPEQVAGRVVDGRTDIFTLGCVLYEMLSGQRAFARDTAAESVAAILNEEPPTLKAGPAELRRLIEHCLEKQPEARFQSARDLSFHLRALLGDTSIGRRDLFRAGARRLVGATIGVTLGVAGVSWLYLSLTTYHITEPTKDSPPVPAPQPRSLASPAPPPTVGAPAVSPGQQLRELLPVLRRQDPPRRQTTAAEQAAPQEAIPRTKVSSSQPVTTRGLESTPTPSPAIAPPAQPPASAAASTAASKGAASRAADTGPDSAPVQIQHEAIGCMVSGQFPLVSARITGEVVPGSARLYFRSALSRAYYYVAMTPDGARYTARLPKPKLLASPIEYYFTARTLRSGSQRTDVASVVVAPNAAACPVGARVAEIGGPGAIEVLSAAIPGMTLTDVLGLEAYATMLADPDHSVRRAAAEALRAQAVPVQEAILKSVRELADGSDNVRLEAARTLDEIAAMIVKQALEPLLKTLTAEGSGARIRSAEAIGELGPPIAAAREALQRSLGDQDGRVRGAAIGAIGKIGSILARVLVALDTAVDDRDPDIAQAASEAREKFRTKLTPP